MNTITSILFLCCLSTHIYDTVNAKSIPEGSGNSPTDQCLALDVIFVLDASGTIPEEIWNIVKSNMMAAIKEYYQVISDVRFGLVRFSTTSDILFGLGAYSSIDDSLNMIDGSQYVGERSNIAHGMRDAKIIIDSQPATRRTVQDVVIIVSDGIENEATDETSHWITELKNTGSIIFTIPITDHYNTSLLSSISSSSTHFIEDLESPVLNSLLTIAASNCPHDADILHNIDEVKSYPKNIQCPGNSNGVFPYGDCQSYVMCEHYGTGFSKNTVMSCPGGLHFNPKSKICDWPSNVLNCSSDSANLGDSSSVNNAISTTIITTVTAPVAEFKCLGKINGYYNDPTTCEYYYQCHHEMAHHSKCPAGLFFDIYAKVCNWPKFVETCIDGVPISLPTDDFTTSPETTTTTTTTTTTARDYHLIKFSWY